MAYWRSLLPVAVLAASATMCSRGEPPLVRPPIGGTSGTFQPTDAGSAVSGRTCSDLAWACWPMPNPEGSGLPNRASYLVAGPSYVVDRVTGLTWQHGSSDQAYDWAGANDYCSNLDVIGLADWRLPTRIELVSLVDFMRPNPATANGVFPDVSASFWTSTKVPGVSSPPVRVWQIAFAGSGATSMASDTFAGRVRCVRSELPAREPKARYRIEGTSPDETVTDLGTGLVWQRTAISDTFTFDAAQAYCAALKIGNQIWRAPSVKELQTLVHDGKAAAPFIDTEAFEGTPSGRALYWTSTPHAETAGAAWFVNFGTGEADFVALVLGDIKDQPNQVRCVR